jgi:hypothetical protein
MNSRTISLWPRFSFLLAFWLLWSPYQRGEAQVYTTYASSGAPALKVSMVSQPDNASTFNELTVNFASVKPGAASAVDRELEIVLYVGGQFEGSVAYHSTFVIPAGQSTASGKVKYIRSHEMTSWSLDVLENGQSIVVGPAQTNNVTTTGVTSNWLVLQHSSDPMPPISNVLEDNANGINGTTVVANQRAFRNTVAKSPTEAPIDWRMYLSYDAIVIHASRLSEIKPDAFAAISTYVLAGGTLIVHVADSSHWQKIDQSLSPHIADVKIDPRWSDLFESQKLLGARRPHGGGQILVVSQFTNRLQGFLPQAYGHPMSVSLVDDDEDYRWFWRNLIQSVGKPPIWMFFLMVIVIVAIMGPGFITFTHKRRHRTLLLFLIPAFSISVSLLILFFNVVREGFATTGRLVSLQFYDSITESGFVWSRQSYFSGAPPRNGLVFSPETLVQPTSVNRVFQPMYDARANVLGHLYQDDDKLRLKYWLQARSQQQLSVAHRVNDFAIPVEIETVSATKLRVTNRSKHPMEVVALRGKGDNFFALESLQPGETQEVDGVTIDELAKTISSWVNRFALTAPLDADLTRRQNPFYYRGTTTTNQLDPIDVMFNRRFGLTDFPEFGYLIIRRQDPTVETPFPETVFLKEQNTHFLLGVHPW